MTLEVDLVRPIILVLINILSDLIDQVDFNRHALEDISDQLEEIFPLSIVNNMLFDQNLKSLFSFLDKIIQSDGPMIKIFLHSNSTKSGIRHAIS
jgi:hypothetical protein